MVIWSFIGFDVSEDKEVSFPRRFSSLPLKNDFKSFST